MKKIRGKTPRQWVANYGRIKDPPECENGHLGCSCSKEPGGPCLDEIIGLAGEEDD